MTTKNLTLNCTYKIKLNNNIEFNEACKQLKTKIENMFNSDKFDKYMCIITKEVTVMIENINEHINAAKKSYSALNEMKENLKKTVDQMDSMSGKVAETITSATEAAKSTIEAAFKVNSIL